MTPIPSHDELLQRYRPHLVYDSQEGFFADSAAIWTDAPGNLLKRRDGTVLAAASPAAGQQRLALSFLATDRYASGAAVQDGDHISHPTRDYTERYRGLHAQPVYRNRTYGHAVAGTDRLWLQYWFFYYYNPAPLSWIGYGKHEGDWEMIQLRLGEDGRPDLAVYAQHADAEVREWRDVRKAGGGDTPVVFVARAAHAAYFEPGNHWNDRADGGRPGPPLALEVVQDDAPAWVGWPGAWGDTRAGSVVEGQSSPRGPGAKRHWRKPDDLLFAAETVSERPPAAPPPPHPARLQARREGGHVVVDYAFPAGGLGSARFLLVTISSPDDPYPPATYSLPIDAPAGTVEVPLGVSDAQRYEVVVSASDADGVTTAAARRVVEPAA